MQHRFLICAVSTVLALAPALADTTTTTNVNPTNSLAVNPTTNQAATTSNVAQQINNQNAGQNSYGNGISCQAPQIALGGYGARTTSGVGLNNANTGITVQYLAPVGRNNTRTCMSLAKEALRARQLDNNFTMIAKCVDFARSGVVLDPGVYPELSHACAGIHVASAQMTPPVDTSKLAPATAPATEVAINIKKAPIYHMSDFSPEHNLELRRLAMHRLQRITSLKTHIAKAGTPTQRKAVVAHIRHEDVHLRAVIAEYDLENAFLRRLLKDQSWHAHNDLRQRILSYNGK